MRSLPFFSMEGLSQPPPAHMGIPPYHLDPTKSVHGKYFVFSCFTYTVVGNECPLDFDLQPFRLSLYACKSFGVPCS